MKNSILNNLFAWSAGLFGFFFLTTANSETEMVLFSNNVISMSSERPEKAAPLAVAVDGDLISWIGSHEQAASKIGPKTKVLRLGSKALLPGFIDAHGHASYTAAATQLANLASPPVGRVVDITTLQATLKKYIEETNPKAGEWVVGLGYDDSLLAENRHPDRDDLDAVSTDHPILLIHVSGHLVATNSRALARGGINSESKDPPGGIIRRRPGTSEPNGVLEESAAYPVRRYMNEPIKDPLASVGQAMRVYAQNGITTVQDGAASPEVVRLLRAAGQAGLINLDVQVYALGQINEEGVQQAYEFGEYQDRVRVNGVKLMLDGSPQGKTAYMTQPYFKPPHGRNSDYRGYPAIPQARADELIAFYLKQKIPIIAHANGDAAADMLIGAVREARPAHDHRTVMIHAQTVREDQLTLMKRLGMIPSYFAAHSFYWGDWHRDSVFGIERASRISPTASTVGRKMVFTIHNDAPIVPPDMLRLLWATTNRLTRTGKVLGDEQRISTYDALLAVTRHAAYQHFEEMQKGSIEVGKIADLVVLDQDPLAVSSKNLMDLEVQMTISRGTIVFEDRQLER